MFPHQLSFILELSVRKLFISPRRLAERLPLQPDSNVLEIGCGSGVFSVEVARRLPAGRLELFDRQREMLNKARRRLEAAGLRAIAGYAQGDARTLAYASDAFDIVFLVAVLGEVPDPRKCLTSIRRVLRPAGVISITEHLPDPDYIRFSRLCSLAEDTGFSFTKRYGSWWSYTANFVRRGSATT